MLKRVISDEKGRALALALIALGVGMLLLPTFLAKISTNLFAARATEVGIIEYYSSDAAIEYTLWHIKCDPIFREGLTVGEPKPLTVTVGNKVVSVSLTQLSSGGGSNEVDAMLVMDVSLSMQGDPLANAKIAAKAFVDILEDYSDENVSHQVGLVSYSDSATPEQELTADYQDVRVAIDGMWAHGYTGIGDAIAVAAGELQSNGRENSVKAIVLLSDGKANACPGCSHPPCEETCKQYAQAMADAACEGTEGGINFFTVALGTDVDTDLMKYIARYDKSEKWAEGDRCEPRNGQEPGEIPDFYQESEDSGELENKFIAIALRLTSPQYNIIATTGDTTIESRVQHSKDLVGIFTWFTR